MVFLVDKDQKFWIKEQAWKRGISKYNKVNFGLLNFIFNRFRKISEIIFRAQTIEYNVLIIFDELR